MPTFQKLHIDSNLDCVLHHGLRASTIQQQIVETARIYKMPSQIHSAILLTVLHNFSFFPNTFFAILIPEKKMLVGYKTKTEHILLHKISREQYAPKNSFGVPNRKKHKAKKADLSGSEGSSPNYYTFIMLKQKILLCIKWPSYIIFNIN